MFSRLRRNLEKGIILLGVQPNTLHELITLILNEYQIQYRFTPIQQHDIFSLFKERDFDVIEPYKEGCKVFISCISSLPSPLYAVVRLRQPVVLDEEEAVGIRYFLFVFGEGKSAKNEK